MWQNILSDSRELKFFRNLAGGSIEICDFGADVNSRAPLNYSVLTRQVQLGQSTISGGIAVYFVSCSLCYVICYVTASVRTVTLATVSGFVTNSKNLNS